MAKNKKNKAQQQQNNAEFAEEVAVTERANKKAARNANQNANNQQQ